MRKTRPPEELHLLASFHFDVAYIKPFREYLPTALGIVAKALRLLDRHPEYRFLVEQVILLEAFWKRFPGKRQPLMRHARAGRLAVAPGMFVMPDMNLISGESMYQQAKIGKAWLRQALGVDADVCWIADCWGHHAQLPQILSQCGYRYYVFYRCMRPDVMKSDFVWEGLDGTRLRTHWLTPLCYGNVFFDGDPDLLRVLTPEQIRAVGWSPARVKALLAELRRYGTPETAMLISGGDFVSPQRTAPRALAEWNASGRRPPARFSTPAQFLDSVNWETKAVVRGDFNAAFQGSYTTNIAIKQANQRLTGKMRAIEALSVILSARPRPYDALWRGVLKQQFHDIICGSICDAALRDFRRESAAAERRLEAACARLLPPRGDRAFFNPLPFARTEMVGHGGRRSELTLPALGFARLPRVPARRPQTRRSLPAVFENAFYRAEIGTDGYVRSMTERRTGAPLTRPGPAPFGALTLQHDHGNPWVSFESPLGPARLPAALTHNAPDPFDRSSPDDLIGKGTLCGTVREARVAWCGADELTVEQRGEISPYVGCPIHVTFRTLVRLAANSPRIEYETEILPRGRYYRLRVAFPTSIRSGVVRHEIPFGIQRRGRHEHAAQTWMDYADRVKGLALFNRGIPANGVDESGIMLLTLFRSVAMENQAPSALSFNEGVAHVFHYAVMPHAAGADAAIVRQAHAFAAPPVACRIPRTQAPATGWGVTPDRVQFSALRWSGKDVFVRIYESTGVPARGHILVPDSVAAHADADGLERRLGEFRPCRGRVPFVLRRFEVRGYLLAARAQ